MKLAAMYSSGSDVKTMMQHQIFYVQNHLLGEIHLLLQQKFSSTSQYSF